MNKVMNFINKQEIRISRTIKWFENNWKNYDKNYLTMDQIAIACSLEYTNFRLNNQWKSDNLKLNNWFNFFEKKDFMQLNLMTEIKNMIKAASVGLGWWSDEKTN